LDVKKKKSEQYLLEESNVCKGRENSLTEEDN